jgi:hypothetical protein
LLHISAQPTSGCPLRPKAAAGVQLLRHIFLNTCALIGISKVIRANRSSVSPAPRLPEREKPKSSCGSKAQTSSLLCQPSAVAVQETPPSFVVIFIDVVASWYVDPSTIASRCFYFLYHFRFASFLHPVCLRCRAVAVLREAIRYALGSPSRSSLGALPPMRAQLTVPIRDPLFRRCSLYE